MSTKIRKAVFPVAGLGTRFLPATKAVPKEMLTVVDRPVIQHVVDEARAAGIEHFIFVTGRGKHIIEDHFDRAFELEATLRARGRTAELAQLEADTPKAGEASFTRQQEPLGLGHAVWCARDLVGDEPFALLLPDMLHLGEKPFLAEMIAAYQPGQNLIGTYAVAPSEAHQYGIVDLDGASDKVAAIRAMVEKPKPGTAPSNLAISGRYILQPSIFNILATQPRGAGNEIQLTDAMLTLSRAAPFVSVRFDGQVYDTGSKLGFLGANIAYALARPDIAADFRALIDKMRA